MIVAHEWDGERDLKAPALFSRRSLKIAVIDRDSTAERKRIREIDKWDACGNNSDNDVDDDADDRTLEPRCRYRV